MPDDSAKLGSEPGYTYYRVGDAVYCARRGRLVRYCAWSAWASSTAARRLANPAPARSCWPRPAIAGGRAVGERIG